MTGVAIPVVLTVIQFWIVMSDVLDNMALALMIIFVLGAIQILVHVHYFLHFSLKAEEDWQAMSMIFTAVVLAGSMRIMFHLDKNIMPAHERMRNFP